MERGDGLALAHWSPDDVGQFASLRPVSSPSSRPSNSGEYGDQWPLLVRQVSPGSATRDRGPSAGIHEHVFSEHPYRRRKISQPGEYSDRWPLLVGNAVSRPAAIASDSAASTPKHLLSEHPRRKGEHLRQSVFRWLPEILSSILSLGCVVGKLPLICSKGRQLTARHQRSSWCWPYTTTRSCRAGLWASLLTLFSPSLRLLPSLVWSCPSWKDWDSCVGTGFRTYPGG